MTSMDERDKIALAQLLMVEISNQQRAKSANPDLVDGLATVMDLVTAYGHILARRRAKDQR